MHVFVQHVPQGHPSFVGFENSAFWFWERGYEISRFEANELTGGVLDQYLTDPENIIIRGGVGTVRCALERMGIHAPVVMDLPQQIREFAGRGVWESTLEEFRRSANETSFDPAVHIKPLVNHKLFTGVLVSDFKDLLPTAHLEGDVPILCQEKVELVSEWRAYILRKQILRVCCYKGDPLVFPDPQIQETAMHEFDGQPIAFSMDWGVTATGETVLIEVNDGFALGNYGLPGHLYTAMVEARWRQLCGLSDNFVGEALAP